MVGLLSSQMFVVFSTLLIFILTISLWILMIYRYIRKPSRSLFYWSLGILLFAIGVLLEVIFAIGIYSEFLIATYLFVVVMLVESLAIGSIQLIKSSKIKVYYYIYSIISTILLIYSLYISNIGNIITNYIVFGVLPLFVVITSSIITFPASAIIIAVAALSYRRNHNLKMLSIISGVVIVSIAGTLYIAAIPVFLYYSEFIGILLLWLGFI